jgi:uncharacterized membrane-anchored protein
LLTDCPHLRDNDTALWIAVIEKASGTKIEDSIPVDLAIRYQHATVVRARAMLQNTLHESEASDRVRMIRAKKAGQKRAWFSNLINW